MLGRTYRYRHGYPWRWAITAELAWRLEHIGPHWARFDCRPLAPLARAGYRWRKAAERKGKRP